MSTWHQDKAMREGRSGPLWHPTQWTIVTNPPNRMMTLTVCTSRALVEAQLEAWRRGPSDQAEYSYILSPGGVRS